MKYSKLITKSVLTLSVLLLFSCEKKSNEQFKDFDQFASNVALQATENCDETCVEVKKEFKYLAYVGEKIYAYWDEKQLEHNIDFKKIAENLENQITNKTTEVQYFQILSKWAAAFKDGHVNAMLKDDMSQMEFYSIPIRFEVLAPGTDHEKLIVAKIGAGVLNLKVGTVVDKIQGKNWQHYIADADKLSSGSTLQMRHRSVGNYIAQVLLESEGPKPIKIEGTYNAKTVSEVLSRNINLYDGASEPIEPDETGINMLKTAILENNIGYLRIDGFGGTQIRRLLDQAMDRLMNTDGLIIDVRKNGGGNLSGDIILKRLANRPIKRFQQKAVSSDYLTALRPSIIFEYDFSAGLRLSENIVRGVLPADDSKIYKKPVVLLTSSYCFSACDTFTSAIKENKLGVVIGEATGGGTGNPQAIELPVSGHSFRYSVVQGFTPVTNTLLEGKGTHPDIIIEPTVEERITGKDLQLEKTLQLISNKIIASTEESNKNLNKSAKLPDDILNIHNSDIKYKSFEIEKDKEVRASKD